MGFHPTKFGLDPGPFHSRVMLSYDKQTDRRTDGQTDRHHRSIYNAPFPIVAGE